ncbi:MAG: hypothetical protein NWE95_01885 [Candidatus Bathyarchaeota archaeon]|nr:hypothetical protein [Candidatus Bathyarchaeota archaeon]
MTRDCILCTGNSDIDNYVEKDPTAYAKLKVYLFSLDALDDLEKNGAIEIVNDYENSTIYVKRNLMKE